MSYDSHLWIYHLDYESGVPFRLRARFQQWLSSHLDSSLFDSSLIMTRLLGFLCSMEVTVTPSSSPSKIYKPPHGRTSSPAVSSHPKFSYQKPSS